MVLRRGEKRVKKVLFAKRGDILEGQMGGHFSGFDSTETPPICTFFMAIMTLYVPFGYS